MFPQNRELPCSWCAVQYIAPGLFLLQDSGFCVNRKCSLATLLTKGQIWRPERWEYRPATAHFRQSSACGAQVSPAARHFGPFSHALARGRLARRPRWWRRRGGATDSCDGGVHGYTCASGLQWPLPGGGGPATAAAPKGKWAQLRIQAPTDRVAKRRICAKLRTRLATRAPVCINVEGCCCKFKAGGRAAGIGRAGGSS